MLFSQDFSPFFLLLLPPNITSSFLSPPKLEKPALPTGVGQDDHDHQLHHRFDNEHHQHRLNPNQINFEREEQLSSREIATSPSFSSPPSSCSSSATCQGWSPGHSLLHCHLDLHSRHHHRHPDNQHLQQLQHLRGGQHPLNTRLQRER